MKQRKSIKERCVMCGKETNIDRNLLISKRKYYVSGAGQLCSSCYRKLYS